ncbi:MAG: hypothetical protein R2837_05500 [Aliarcobacter sp.]
MALLHRTGRAKEALDAGFTLEDTGILEIEKYLTGLYLAQTHKR